MIRSNRARAAVALAALAVVAAACGDTTETDDAATTTTAGSGEPSVSFASPADGDEVSNPVAVTFDAANFTVEPAGEVTEGAGHLHVMIDTPCVEPGEVIPSDEQHRHFGKAQLEAALDLEAGEHTLCLQAADGAHVALDITDEITVTVDDSASVAFLQPASGASVTSPVAVKLKAYNFTLEPAGDVHDHAGHLHLMIDTECIEPGETIPKDDQHVHLGKGETETELTLEPGEHTLCLQAADGAHTALDITRQVTFTVT